MNQNCVCGHPLSEHAHGECHALIAGLESQTWCPCKKVEAYDSRADTSDHIGKVRTYMGLAIKDLLDRSTVHDASKLVSPEVEAFDIATPKLQHLVYGSDEYKQSLKELGPALEHHLSSNSHHPEWGSPGLEWKSIAGLEGRYEVSNYGDVRSVARLEPRDGGRGDLTVSQKELTPNVTPKGYLRIQLVDGEGKRLNKMVHLLVAETFISNSEGKPQVNHLDGVKINNHISNLVWATASENLQHAYDTGLKEPPVKWVVHCPELDLTTLGTVKMAEAVARHLTGDTPSAASILNAMDSGRALRGLTFEGTLLAEARRSMITKMSLMDLVEMICDWYAASQRLRKPTPSPPGQKEVPQYTNDFERSILLNQERFGYSDEVREILMNTARELGFIS